MVEKTAKEVPATFNARAETKGSELTSSRGGQQHELSMLAGGSHEIFGMPASGRTLAAE
jgi:hypothetical protein